MKNQFGGGRGIKKKFKSLLNVLQYYFCCLCSVLAMKHVGSLTRD